MKQMSTAKQLCPCCIWIVITICPTKGMYLNVRPISCLHYVRYWDSLNCQRQVTLRLSEWGVQYNIIMFENLLKPTCKCVQKMWMTVTVWSCSSFTSNLQIPYWVMHRAYTRIAFKVWTHALIAIWHTSKSVHLPCGLNIPLLSCCLSWDACLFFLIKTFLLCLWWNQGTIQLVLWHFLPVDGKTQRADEFPTEFEGLHLLWRST